MSSLTNNYFWRLVPGNPIFVRVVEAAARRTRHALIRIGYLGVLVLVAVLSLLALTAQTGGTLTELSQQSAKLFQIISYLQLALACLLAPIFTAGAITQEKDNQTYNVLLSTPLSNAQIVLGSLLSRLYFVLALLASGIPIFLITQLYGGVTGRSILLSFMIAASTAVFTGAVAVAIAVVRVGTGKTIFAFYIVISLYLVALWVLAESALFAPPAGQINWTSYLPALHPFLSLQAVLRPPESLPPELLAGSTGLGRLWLTAPHYAYVGWTLSASAVMVTLGTIFVRHAHARTRTDWRRKLRLWLGGNRQTRPPRTVWANPVAWREAATRASAGGKSLMRWVFLVGGLALGVTLLIAYTTGQLDAAMTRAALQATLWVELGIVLLVLCNVSASAITREREDGTLDLLLVTPITSRYYIWGKLRGLLSFAAVLLAVPVATALLFALAGLLGEQPTVTPPLGGAGLAIPLMPIEAVLELALVMLAFCAATIMIALTMSLKVRGTIGAVIGSVAIVGTAALGSTACGRVSAETIPVVGPLVGMASPFVAIALAVSPHQVLGREFNYLPAELSRLRWLLLAFSFGSAAAYALVVYGLYSSMVKSFDMVIRRQSR